jgi:hypothetical protein
MFKMLAKRWRRVTLTVLPFLLLTSMTACSTRYVVVHGDETVIVKKVDWDTMYSDNERLIQALLECKAR